MLALGGAFLLPACSSGGPYCRYLCPYGGLLRGARAGPPRRHDHARQGTGLRAVPAACPYGAIEKMRAVRQRLPRTARAATRLPVRDAASGAMPAAEPRHDAGGAARRARRLGAASAVVALVADLGLAGDYAASRTQAARGRCRRRGPPGAGEGRTPGPRPPSTASRSASPTRSHGRDRRGRRRSPGCCIAVGRPPRWLGAVAPVAAAATAAAARGAGGDALRNAAARSRRQAAAAGRSGGGERGNRRSISRSWTGSSSDGRSTEAAIPILQAIQAHYRYLPDEALRRVCELTEITPAQIAGTSSFYARFRRSPVGRARRPGLPRHRVPRVRRAADHRGAAPPPGHPRRRRHRRRAACSPSRRWPAWAAAAWRRC